jgi:phosphohistidine phosphatase
MRRLMLLRHGKSEWTDGVKDLDRPLAKRGREAVPRVAAHMAEEQLLPDLALVSPARRARETWDLVAPALDGVEARFEPRIYEAPEARLLAVLREVEPEVRTLLMIGHNPGFEDLAARLVGRGDRSASERLSEKFPTAALAVIDFEADSWAEVAAGAGRLERFVTPKSLGTGEDEEGRSA